MISTIASGKLFSEAILEIIFFDKNISYIYIYYSLENIDLCVSKPLDLAISNLPLSWNVSQVLIQSPK